MLATKYIIKLKNLDMNCIKQVKKTYTKISRGIQLQKLELLANQPDVPIAQVATPFIKH